MALSMAIFFTLLPGCKSQWPMGHAPARLLLETSCNFHHNLACLYANQIPLISEEEKMCHGRCIVLPMYCAVLYCNVLYEPVTNQLN